MATKYHQTMFTQGTIMSQAKPGAMRRFDSEHLDSALEHVIAKKP